MKKGGMDALGWWVMSGFKAHLSVRIRHGDLNMTQGILDPVELEL